MALDIGAQPFGNWSGCHAVAWDLNAPPYGDRKIADLFQKHSYPFGLIVNVDGARFVDEGADFRNYTYAKYGREILKQPQRAAFQLFDAKVTHLLRDEYRIPQVSKVEAGTVEELARGAGDRPPRSRPDRRGVQRIGPAGRLQPDGARWQTHGWGEPPQVPLGSGPRHSALRRLRRDLRHYFHVRRPADRRSDPGPRHGGCADSRPLRRG